MYTSNKQNAFQQQENTQKFLRTSIEENFEVILGKK